MHTLQRVRWSWFSRVADPGYWWDDVFVTSDPGMERLRMGLRPLLSAVLCSLVLSWLAGRFRL